MNPTQSLLNAPLLERKHSPSPATSTRFRLTPEDILLQKHLNAVKKTYEQFQEYMTNDGWKYQSTLEAINSFFEIAQSDLEKKQQEQMTPPPPTPPQRNYLLVPKSDTEDRILPGEFVLCIDNSSMEVFNGCARSSEYHLIHARGFSGSPATRYGSAIHHYLELRLRGQSQDEAMQNMVSLFATYPPLPPDEWRTVDHAVNAMTQYEQRYKQESRLEVVHHHGRPLIEIPFRVPLTTIDVDSLIPYSPSQLMSQQSLVECGLHADDNCFTVKKIHVYWTGKIDLVCKYDGQPAILDHKTTSMLGSLFYKEFELSSQTVGYVWATRNMAQLTDLEEFRNVSRFVLDVIVGRKPSRTGIAHEFERHVYTYTDEQIAEWHYNTTHIVADFLSHLVRGHFPMQTRWCVNKYGLCPYHDVCTLPKEYRLQHLQNAFSLITWSPLK